MNSEGKEALTHPVQILGAIKAPFEKNNLLHYTWQLIYPLRIFFSFGSEKLRVDLPCYIGQALFFQIQKLKLTLI